jgi:hypothetical protein
MMRWASPIKGEKFGQFGAVYQIIYFPYSIRKDRVKSEIVNYNNIMAEFYDDHCKKYYDHYQNNPEQYYNYYYNNFDQYFDNNHDDSNDSNYDKESYHYEENYSKINVNNYKKNKFNHNSDNSEFAPPIILNPIIDNHSGSTSTPVKQVHKKKTKKQNRKTTKKIIVKHAPTESERSVSQLIETTNIKIENSADNSINSPIPSASNIDNAITKLKENIIIVDNQIKPVVKNIESNEVGPIVDNLIKSIEDVVAVPVIVTNTKEVDVDVDVDVDVGVDVDIDVAINSEIKDVDNALANLIEKKCDDKLIIETCEKVNEKFSEHKCESLNHTQHMHKNNKSKYPNIINTKPIIKKITVDLDGSSILKSAQLFSQTSVTNKRKVTSSVTKKKTMRNKNKPKAVHKKDSEQIVISAETTNIVKKQVDLVTCEKVTTNNLNIELNTKPPRNINKKSIKKKQPEKKMFDASLYKKGTDMQIIYDNTNKNKSKCFMTKLEKNKSREKIDFSMTIEIDSMILSEDVSIFKNIAINGVPNGTYPIIENLYVTIIHNYINKHNANIKVALSNIFINILHIFKKVEYLYIRTCISDDVSPLKYFSTLYYNINPSNEFVTFIRQNGTTNATSFHPKNVRYLGGIENISSRLGIFSDTKILHYMYQSNDLHNVWEQSWNKLFTLHRNNMNFNVAKKVEPNFIIASSASKDHKTTVNKGKYTIHKVNDIKIDNTINNNIDNNSSSSSGSNYMTIEYDKNHSDTYDNYSELYFDIVENSPNNFSKVKALLSQNELLNKIVVRLSKNFMTNRGFSNEILNYIKKNVSLKDLFIIYDEGNTIAATYDYVIESFNIENIYSVHVYYTEYEGSYIRISLSNKMEDVSTIKMDYRLKSNQSKNTFVCFLNKIIEYVESGTKSYSINYEDKTVISNNYTIGQNMKSLINKISINMRVIDAISNFRMSDIPID